MRDLSDVLSTHGLPSIKNIVGFLIAEECLRCFKDFVVYFGKYYLLGYNILMDMDVNKVDLAPYHCGLLQSLGYF